MTRKQREKPSVKQRWRMVDMYLAGKSYYRVEKQLGFHRAQVRYWVHKYLDSNFHCLPNGGNKTGCFQRFELPLVHLEVGFSFVTS